MKYNSFAFLFLAIFAACTPQEKSENIADDATRDSVLTLENERLRLGIELQGGMYTSLELKNKPLNPFGWKATPEQMPENNLPHIFKGHFLCTGRWGAPSQGEISAGIPHNGEVNTQFWSIEKQDRNNGLLHLVMHCEAPLEKLDVTREIRMPEQGQFFIVRETFKNNLPIGRVSNVVQHATIGPPFLSKSTIINTNATYGFDQRTSYQYLEDSSFLWPDGRLSNGQQIDLQTVTAESGYVTTHIFNDSIGWITALNPEQGLLLGYIWNTGEYPWLNVWHYPVDGIPVAQGLEFGTTGLGQPYELLLNNRVDFYGRNSFEYIDAGEVIRKSWICFLLEIPKGFSSVRSVELISGRLTLHGVNGESISLPITGKIW